MARLPSSVAEFLSGKRFAVAGVSRSPTQAANAVYRKLRGSGFEVFPVNPNATEVESARLLPGLGLNTAPNRPPCDRHPSERLRRAGTSVRCSRHRPRVASPVVRSRQRLRRSDAGVQGAWYPVHRGWLPADVLRARGCGAPLLPLVAAPTRRAASGLVESSAPGRPVQFESGRSRRTNPPPFT